MKTIISFLSTISIAIVIILSCSCDSSNWEAELSDLFQKERELTESYRSGEISEIEYTNSVQVVSESAQTIVNLHKKDLFNSQVDTLRKKGISQDIVDFTSKATPSKELILEPFWKDHQPGDDLVRMNPEGMTHMVLMRQLSREEYSSLSADPQSFHLIDLSGTGCKTAMRDTNSVYTVSFRKEYCRWTPIEAYKYERK